MKVIKFAPGLVPVLKHQEHDQSSHGSWADGSDAPSSQDDYKMGHRPGDIESGASLDNVSGNDIYPEDVYSPNGLRNYSTGYPELDKEAHALIMRAKGNPEMTVTIYRAVPNDANITEIRDGDWVTPTKGYAQIHGESNLNDDFKIISAEVKAKDIYTSGDSWHEWGYSKSSSVEKHGSHDQKTHGSWATGDLHEGNGYLDSDAHPKYDYDSMDGTYLEAYTGPYSNSVNDYLRLGKITERDESQYAPSLDKEEIAEYVDAMDNIISQTETPREMALYRGIGGDGYDTFAAMKVGDVYTDKGYVSTTPDPKQLWEFLPANNGGYKGTVLEITLPKGSQALSVKKYFKGVSSSYAPSEAILDENEHILPRGLKFKVTGIGETRVSSNSQREGNPADLLIQVEVVG